MQVLFLLAQSLSRDLQKGYRTEAQERAIKLRQTHGGIEEVALRPAKVSGQT